MASSASKIAEHHKSAAEHLEAAAQHHREAAKHYEAGATEKAAYHGMIARGCARQAEHHTDEAAKAQAEHYIKSEK